MSTHYKELIVWQRAMDLASHTYSVTKRFPSDERFGLTSQLRRASVSVPSNIAEGQGRLTKGEFKQFLGHARGSLYEIETQVLLAHRLGLVDESQCETYNELITEVGKLLHGLIRSLN